MYAFFQKHLNNPGIAKDVETQLLTNDELRVTPTGQVSLSLQSETVFSLNLKRAGKLESILEEQRKNSAGFPGDAVRSAMVLSGYIGPANVEKPVFTGKIVKEKYIIEKYFVKGEGDYVIPYLLFRPIVSSAGAVICLYPSGKESASRPGSDAEILTNNGFTVLYPDLIGTGETGPGMLQGDAYFKGVSHNLWYAAMICGRSIAGIRAADLVRLAMVLHDYHNIKDVSAIAYGEMCPVLIHAAAFNPIIRKVTLSEPSGSYMSIVKDRMYAPSLIMNSVPGALEKYDLDDLIKAISPREVIIRN
jgi:hypothetical protein